MGPVQFSPGIFLPEHFSRPSCFGSTPVEASIYQGFSRLLSRIYKPLSQTAAHRFERVVGSLLAELTNKSPHGIVMPKTAFNSGGLIAGGPIVLSSSEEGRARSL